MRIAKTLTLSLLVTTSLLGTAFAAGATTGFAGDAIAPMPLNAALDRFAKDTGLQLLYVSTLADGVRTSGAPAGLSPRATLDTLLAGTGLQSKFINAGTVTITKAQQVEPLQLAQAAPRQAVETVTVTSSKLGGADVQSIPIAITALSQEQLTATQTAGGPDLVKQVPNLTFTKTNFTGYSINIRGIGTQAISVTTDPAVAVAMNDIPFIRNHFFEQEFYDVGQLEVLRGPQGTLYGRNATAGVVNITSAKPTDQFEATASGEIGNYHQRRFEGMINLPIVDDRLDIRLAGEWTKRQGYSYNTLTNSRTDGRDLWSGRATIGFKPFENTQSYLIWEHFSEDDDRLRSSKQLCKTDNGPGNVNGQPVVVPDSLANVFVFGINALSQGCLPTSLYSQDAYQVPNGFSLPYVSGLGYIGYLTLGVDPYANKTQSTNLRQIESTIQPAYKAKNDLVEWNTDVRIGQSLTFSSQTGFNNDFLSSTEDYNRFETAPGIFKTGVGPDADPGLAFLSTIYPRIATLVDANHVFCDPQLGCSDRLVAQDLSKEHSWQFSQEFRLASSFEGPLNFSVGGNYLHYETEEDYYVFFNTITLFAADSGPIQSVPWVPGVSDDHECLSRLSSNNGGGGYQYPNPALGESQPTYGCTYIDPNPISQVNGEGHNYFLSKNPYTLNSYAAFGEAYYNVLSDLKLIAGLRFTEDRKHFINYPSQLLNQGYGYGTSGTVDQNWGELTGRAAANWTPKLDFTDQTLVYLSYAHGYKAGGANPPGAVSYSYGTGAGIQGTAVHPLTFKPEFIDAFELGSKNTLFDGALTLNASAFYYNYENYQISELVDRTSINLNFDAHVKGAELEATWEPVPGLRFNFAGGWEDTALAKGSKAIDLMDRTAGNADWMVVKPFVTQTSNCVFPRDVVAYLIEYGMNFGIGNPSVSACGYAYISHLDPITQMPYDQHSPVDTFGVTVPDGYQGYDPSTAPNNGEGFYKDIGGKELPNAPPFTLSAGAQYSLPLSTQWAGTLRGDFYWQDNSWARVFNDDPYDRIHGYRNVNLTLIFTNQNGWQVMLYDKNVFNTTAITGTFLNTDDSGLTTNVFLTDPKLIGVRVTKNW